MTKSDYNKRYYWSHREKILAQEKKHRKDHQEKKLAQDRNYRIGHRKERSEYQRKYDKEHREERLEYGRKNHLKTVHGLTVSDYNRLFVEQNGKCAVCGKHQSILSQRLDVDHDHKTGKIRGLLCRGCNRMLGRYENGRCFKIKITIKFEKFLRNGAN